MKEYSVYLNLKMTEVTVHCICFVFRINLQFCTVSGYRLGTGRVNYLTTKNKKQTLKVAV